MLPHLFMSPDLCSPGQNPHVVWATVSASARAALEGAKCGAHSQELPSLVPPVRDNQGTGFLGASNLLEGPELPPRQ